MGQDAMKMSAQYEQALTDLRVTIGEKDQQISMLQEAVKRLDRSHGDVQARGERLVLMAEEMGECQHIIGKALRHGIESKHPNTGVSNRHLLETEIADVLAAVFLLVECADVSKTDIEHLTVRKLRRIRPYLHTQANIDAAARLADKLESEL